MSRKTKVHSSFWPRGSAIYLVLGSKEPTKGTGLCPGSVLQPGICSPGAGLGLDARPLLWLRQLPKRCPCGVQRARSGQAGEETVVKLQTEKNCCVGSCAPEPGGRWCLGHDLRDCGAGQGAGWSPAGRGDHNRAGRARGPWEPLLPGQPVATLEL